jgi:transcriptional regulator GlxA family with amidase domain
MESAGTIKRSSRADHGTITVAWIVVAGRFLDDRGGDGSTSESARELPAACGDCEFLLRFYSRRALMSDETRRRWIAPGRQRFEESPMSRRRVGILIFADVEVLDFCGPFEVFSTTRLTDPRVRDDPSPYEVVLIAESREVIVATGGLKVLADHTLEDCPPLDLLVVPGGWGTRQQASNPTLLDWIERRSREVETVASVCTGAMLLAGAGLLDGRRATTHHASLDRMKASFPAVSVVGGERVVEDGSFVTSAGISAGIDLALRLVARHHGEAVARGTARHMEYPYPGP